MINESKRIYEWSQIRKRWFRNSYVFASGGGFSKIYRVASVEHFSEDKKGPFYSWEIYGPFTKKKAFEEAINENNHLNNILFK